MVRLEEIKPFLGYFSRRLLTWMLILFVGLNLLFFLPRLMPVNPVDLFLNRVLGGVGGAGLGAGGVGSAANPVMGKAIEEMRQRFLELFGLDKPVLVQYLLFWRRIFTFEYGYSFHEFPKTVDTIILSALPWTLALVVPATVIGFIVGSYIGVVASIRPGKLNKAVFYLFVILLQTPYYWLAMIFLTVFSVWLRILPIGGAYSDRWITPAPTWGFFVDAIQHYILPFVTLTVPTIGGYAAGMRASVASEARSGYVEFCRYLGFSHKTIIKYLFRNAILPNMTWFPITFAGTISQTLIVEVVFSYPGLGWWLYISAFTLDYPVMEATFSMIMFTVVFGSLIVEILYGVLNPRIVSSR